MIESVLDLNTVGEWVRTGGTFGLLIIAAKFFVDNRRLKMQERVSDRDGYGVLITALQEDVSRVREQHRNCEDRLVAVEQQLVGVHRQLVMQASMSAVPIGPASEHVRGAAERVAKVIGDQLGSDDAAAERKAARRQQEEGE